MKNYRKVPAVIGGAVVPATEMFVLEVLVNLGKNVPVSEIAKEIGDSISDASLYTLLKRLQKRGLVDREDAELEVFGRTVKRVLWHGSQTATDYYADERVYQNDTRESAKGTAMAG